LTTVRAAPGLVGLARRRFRAGGRSSVFRLAGFCKPALSPLRIVAQHWPPPSSATRPLASAAAYSAYGSRPGPAV
jgi:hypothetical protein